MHSSMYYVYLLRCADDSLYTGITTNVERRIAEHNGSTNKAAKYTRARQPVSLLYYTSHPTRSDAAKEEARIKKLSRTQKEVLVQKQNILSPKGLSQST